MIKLEEVLDLAEEYFESKQHLNDIERKDLQYDNKETEPVQNDALTETFVVEKLYLQRKFQVMKRILKFKNKVQSQSCQKMRNSYLRRIKSLLLMKLGLVLKRNFTARRMR